MTATAPLRSIALLVAFAAALAFGPAAPAPTRAAAFQGLAPEAGDRPSLVVPVQRGGGFRAPSYSPPPVYRAPSPAPSYRAPTYNAPSYRPSPPAYRPPTFNAPPQTFRPPPPTFRAAPTVQRPAPSWRQGPAVSSRSLLPGRIQPPSAREMLPLRPSRAPAAGMTADPRRRGPGWALTAGARGPATMPRISLRPPERPGGIAVPVIRSAGATAPRIASLGPATPRLADRPARIAVAAPVLSRPGVRPAALAPPRERSAAIARLAGTRQFDAEQRRRMAVGGSPSIAEMKRGFRGQFTAAGQAMVTVRGRLLLVRPSLIGVRAPTPALANDTRAAPAAHTARPASSSPPPPPNPPVANDNTQPSSVVARTTPPPPTSRSGVGGQSFVMVQGSKTPFVHRSMAGLTGVTASDAKRLLILGSAQKDVVTLDRRLVRQQGTVRETGQDNVQRGSKAGATGTASRQGMKLAAGAGALALATATAGATQRPAVDPASNDDTPPSSRKQGGKSPGVGGGGSSPHGGSKFILSALGQRIVVGRWPSGNSEAVVRGATGRQRLVALAPNDPFSSALVGLYAKTKRSTEFTANENYPGRRQPSAAAFKTLALPNAEMVAGSRMAKLALVKSHNDPDSVWDQKTLANNDNLKKKLDGYASGSIGNSVRKLDLTGKTPEEIHKELTTTMGFRHKREPLSIGQGEYRKRDGSTTTDRNDPDIVPHDLYTHDDGGMVRVKPEGDPSSVRPEPHMSKSVVYRQHDTSFTNEVFKITNDGIAVPKSPRSEDGMRDMISVSNDKYEYRGFVDTSMGYAHTNVKF